VPLNGLKLQEQTKTGKLFCWKTSRLWSSTLKIHT